MELLSLYCTIEPVVLAFQLFSNVHAHIHSPSMNYYGDPPDDPPYPVDPIPEKIIAGQQENHPR